MKYISSDTNVWIDFVTINRIALPFRLPYTYIMNQDAIDEELLSPPDFKEQLLNAGLIPTELTDEEFLLAETYGSQYRRLSIHDRIALAIAKQRKIKLLTGDQALRNAAKAEGVDPIGTIGILDQLHEQNLITTEEYVDCLKALRSHNGKIVRLPSSALEERIQRFNVVTRSG